jgi:hypothetical protein
MAPRWSLYRDRRFTVLRCGEQLLVQGKEEDVNQGNSD